MQRGQPKPTYHASWASRQHFMFPPLILVACRIYTRACLVKSFGKDDALIIAAAVSTCAIFFIIILASESDKLTKAGDLYQLCVLGGGMIILIVEGYYGLGRHNDTLSNEDEKMYTLLSWMQTLFVSSIGMAAIKVSVGCSLLRLSTNRRFCQLLYGLIGFTVLYCVLGFLSVFLYCHPVEGLWDDEVNATCYPEWVYIRLGFFNTACNMFTDICFATAPLPLIWSLKLDRRVQLYLVIIFSLGYLAVAMAVAKAVCQAVVWRDADRTFDHWIQFFGFLEANVSLMAASVPALKPLLGKWFSLPNESCCRSPAPDITAPGGGRRNPPTSFDIEAELGLRGVNTNAGSGGKGCDGSERQFGHGPHDIISNSDESGMDSALHSPSEYVDQMYGSQELILSDIHSKRDSIIIMKTTEVTVSRN
ncbi:hypothetical protein PG994_008527 [Apiospora phragmitis]|uniref:Rhodopsin domain-containing protein n=1 Tax=Apiospora phragmitis TaxID=2905665 RepID=A0ABR1UGQ8_9PEZI